MEEIGDDDLVTLTEACDLFFKGRLTKSSLRVEASRGNLEIIRIANKDFVTRNGIRRMIDKCRLPAAEPERSDRSSSKEAAKAFLKLKLAELKAESRKGK
jgi:predicted deacylase